MKEKNNVEWQLFQTLKWIFVLTSKFGFSRFLLLSTSVTPIKWKISRLAVESLQGFSSYKSKHSKLRNLKFLYIKVCMSQIFKKLSIKTSFFLKIHLSWGGFPRKHLVDPFHHLKLYPIFSYYILLKKARENRFIRNFVFTFICSHVSNLITYLGSCREKYWLCQ
jgi:hypothetical protein